MTETKQPVFYVGPNVEHSPTYSKKTLFVVGKQDLNKILNLARDHKATHILMGAKKSFNIDPSDNTHYWDLTIQALLERGFWVTFEYPSHVHEHVLKMLSINVWTSRMFVPLLNVCIPGIQTSNLNLTVKIDDTDFRATNPGIWCMHFHEVTDSNRFTDWVEYGTDLVIQDEEVEEPTPMPPYVPEPPKAETIDITTLRPIEQTAVINDENLGLDPESKSMLKGEPEKIIEKLDMSALDTAEAYAGKEPAKKAKK